MLSGSRLISGKEALVIMRTLKTITVAAMLTGFLATVVMVSAASRTTGEDQFDAGATYKAKCVACHGQKAEKKFDAALPEDQMVDAIMKGKKVEKPPHMPAYGEKGVTAEQAKAMIEHMKQLKSTP